MKAELSNSQANTKLFIERFDEYYLDVSIVINGQFLKHRTYIYTDSDSLKEFLRKITMQEFEPRGVRNWHTVEKDFNLRVSKDSTGHFMFNIILEHDKGENDYWSLATRFYVELSEAKSFASQIDKVL